MDIVYASINAVVAHAGQRVKLTPGEAWDAEDSLVRAYPEHFTKAPLYVRRTEGYVPVAEAIEEATKRPGTRRGWRGSRR